MLHSTPELFAASDTADEAPARAAVADTRIALELLLELGMRTVDGDASALVGIAPALSIAVERLEQVHRSLQERALCASTPYCTLLARHAEHRRESDLRELDVLGKIVSQAPKPYTVGCGVVAAALVLLANLDSDERWYKRLVLVGPVAEAA